MSVRSRSTTRTGSDEEASYAMEGEELREKAVTVIRRVIDKLNGLDFYDAAKNNTVDSAISRSSHR